MVLVRVLVVAMLTQSVDSTTCNLAGNWGGIGYTGSLFQAGAPIGKSFLFFSCAFAVTLTNMCTHSLRRTCTLQVVEPDGASNFTVFYKDAPQVGAIIVNLLE